MIVLDASAAVAALIDDEGGATARLHMAAATQRHAPHVLDLEVANALRKLALRARISGELASAALAHFRRIDITRYPHEPLLDRIWELRHQVTPYDAVYIALAETLDVPLVTFDGRLAAAPGITCEVALLG
jgi:predicted nucleic acid-binding protein